MMQFNFAGIFFSRQLVSDSQTQYICCVRYAAARDTSSPELVQHIICGAVSIEFGLGNLLELKLTNISLAGDSPLCAGVYSVPRSLFSLVMLPSSLLRLASEDVSLITSA